MDFTAVITGLIKSLKYLNLNEKKAKTIPTATAKINPHIILHIDSNIICQNSASSASALNLSKTAVGDTIKIFNIP